MCMYGWLWSDSSQNVYHIIDFIFLSVHFDMSNVLVNNVIHIPFLSYMFHTFKCCMIIALLKFSCKLYLLCTYHIK